MVTYFITTSSRRLVKIGKTDRLRKRLVAFGTHNHEAIILLRTIEGDHERALHNRFIECWSHKEWFWLYGDLEEFACGNASVEEVLSRRPVHRSDFYRWLMRQRQRDEPIGDFANDVAGDKTFPLQEVSWPAIKDYLWMKRAAPVAVLTAVRAYREWKTQGRVRTPVTFYGSGPVPTVAGLRPGLVPAPEPVPGTGSPQVVDSARVTGSRPRAATVLPLRPGNPKRRTGGKLKPRYPAKSVK